MKFIKFSFLLILAILLTLSCTQKDNPVGLNEGPEPTEIVLADTSLFGNVYSFQDSMGTYSSNTKLIVGNYDNVKIRSLLKFDALPDTVETIENDQIQITFTNKDSLNFGRMLKFAKVNQAWNANYVNWENATDSTQWQADAFIDIDFEYEITEWADSTIISVPSEKIYHQLDGNLVIDSLIANNGITIYADENGENSYVEFYSLESDADPTIGFQYTTSAADSLLSYESAVDSDAILYEKIDGSNTNYEKYEDELMISNIPPVKMFINIDFSAETMLENLSNINNIDELRRMTVNKAEIIFHKKNEGQFPKQAIFSLRPYVLTTDSPAFPPNYYEDYIFVSYSNDSAIDTADEEYSLDITKILQGVVAEEIDYHGLLFRSTGEDSDFEFVKFATKFNSDENLRPEIRIIYTPPFLDE